MALLTACAWVLTKNEFLGALCTGNVAFTHFAGSRGFLPQARALETQPCSSLTGPRSPVPTAPRVPTGPHRCTPHRWILPATLFTNTSCFSALRTESAPGELAFLLLFFLSPPLQGAHGRIKTAVECTDGKHVSA